MSGIDLTGMVLLAAPAGDYDRRLVLLTKERGKITAFARSARKPNSPMLASTVPFSFGTFHLYEGKSAYTLVGADISNYFDELKTDFEGAYYGFYFMEFAAYYAQENMDGKDMLNLLYAALTALENPRLDKKTARYAYEVRLMVQGGEFPQDVVKDGSLSEGCRYAFWYMITSPLQKLFAFKVSEQVLEEISKTQDRIRGKLIDRKFKSLEILETVTS